MDIIINAPSPGAESVQIGNYYHNILNCLGYPENSPPVAELLRRYHHLDGHWLVLSPVHWQATHNDAMIVACDEALDLTDEESRDWFAALVEFLEHDNVKLHYHDAYTWLIQFSECPPINARPVHQLLHQSLMQQLQALDASLFWSRFITENQMFFSEHPLNKTRTGRYPINGVWVWGDGELIQGNQALVCGDEAACELAQIVSTQVSRYVPSPRILKNTIMLFSAFNEQQTDQFKKNTVHWYWNNASYETRALGWFSRLLHQLIRRDSK